MHRRTVVLGLCSTAVLYGARALAADPGRFDRRLEGSPSSGLVVGMYFSIGCPHCGNWTRTVWPKIRQDLIATGKILWEWLDCPLDALSVTGQAVARLLPPDRYTSAVTGLLTDQSWIGGREAGLRKAMTPYGATDATFAGVTPQLRAWLMAAELLAKADGVPVTPTFTAHGKLMPGEMTFGAIASLAVKPA